jgi:hypothetical protein
MNGGNPMTIHLACKDCQTMVPVQVYDVRAIDIVTVLCEACLTTRVTQVKEKRQPLDHNADSFPSASEIPEA